MWHTVPTSCEVWQLRCTCCCDRRLFGRWLADCRLLGCWLLDAWLLTIDAWLSNDLHAHRSSCTLQNQPALLQPLAPRLLAATAVPTVGQIPLLRRFRVREEFSFVDLLESHLQSRLAIIIAHRMHCPSRWRRSPSTADRARLGRRIGGGIRALHGRAELATLCVHAARRAVGQIENSGDGNWATAFI